MTVNREAGAPATAEALDFARRALAAGNDKAANLVRRLEQRLREEQNSR
jgi:hypothetical protein